MVAKVPRFVTLRVGVEAEVMEMAPEEEAAMLTLWVDNYMVALLEEVVSL